MLKITNELTLKKVGPGYSLVKTWVETHDKDDKLLPTPVNKEKTLCYPADLEGAMKIVVRYYTDKIIESDKLCSFEDLIKEIKNVGTKLHEPFTAISEGICKDCNKILEKFNNDLELLNTAIESKEVITNKDQVKVKVKPKVAKAIVVDDEIVSSDW